MYVSDLWHAVCGVRPPLVCHTTRVMWRPLTAGKSVGQEPCANVPSQERLHTRLVDLTTLKARNRFVGVAVNTSTSLLTSNFRALLSGERLLVHYGLPRSFVSRRQQFQILSREPFASDRGHIVYYHRRHLFYNLLTYSSILSCPPWQCLVLQNTRSSVGKPCYMRVMVKWHSTPPVGLSCIIFSCGTYV